MSSNSSSSNLSKAIHDIRDYFRQLDMVVFVLSASFTALLAFFNYKYKWWAYVSNHSFAFRLMAWYCMSGASFFFTYFMIAWRSRRGFLNDTHFIMIMIAAPLIFSIRTSSPAIDLLAADRTLHIFWNKVLYFPVLAVLILSLAWGMWIYCGRPEYFLGFKSSQWNWQPYSWMLLFMLPLIAWASTRGDFLAYYPRLFAIERLFPKDMISWKERIAYEISYGSDFVAVESFFRGVLVVGFARWVGSAAILPMACFYCTIHFGKPLIECVSSFFGGLLLGVMSYNSKSVYGGLMVHLGIAWMMEAGSILGRLFISH